MSSSAPKQATKVTTSSLYAQWASVYDTDGNILQAIDDSLFPSLLNSGLSYLSPSEPITITELGCGTGRNTAKLLLPLPSPAPSSETNNDEEPSKQQELQISKINALDLSPEMLSLAEKRCSSLLSTQPNLKNPPPALTYHPFDALSPPTTHAFLEEIQHTADLVVSTLVLEHVPIDVFFRTVRHLLKGPSASTHPSTTNPGGQRGVLVLTNMHPEMGSISQAGFTDPITGEKIQGSSYAHVIEDVVRGAEEFGFRLLGEVKERSVGEEDIGEGKLLGVRGKKWIGKRVWFGCVFGLV